MLQKVEWLAKSLKHALAKLSLLYIFSCYVNFRTTGATLSARISGIVLVVDRR